MKIKAKTSYNIAFYGWVAFNIGCIIYTIVDVIVKICK